MKKKETKQGMKKNTRASAIEKPKFKQKHFSNQKKQDTKSHSIRHSENQKDAATSKATAEYKHMKHQPNRKKIFENRSNERYDENRKNKELIRLNKLISNSGYCSRRDADILISSGSVTVDGQIVTQLGYKVNINADVRIDNVPIRPEKLRYILLNKPKNVITTCDDPRGRKTVLDLIKGACKERVYPVGRLDRNTTGLLILTNDGEFAKKIAHPSSKVKKLYEVTLDKKLKQEHFQEIAKGVWLDEDTFVDVDDLAFVEGNKSGTVIGIEIHSGKYHVVKRIFEKFGYNVIKLDRTKIDILTKKDLPRGRWRFLTESEVQLLKRF